MEGPQRRDINELLVNGYFKTARGKSPSGSASASTNGPSLAIPEYTSHRDRSRSRGPRRTPPPRPIVEDEHVSLSRESSVSSQIPSYDPPLRGIIEQNPIILEADVTQAEAARLQAEPCPKPKDENPERRFVLMPKSDPNGSNEQSEEERRKKSKSTQDPARREEMRETPRSRVERRKSRQDLPTLETKVPREIPPQFRRSASASATIPKENGETPRAGGQVPRTPAGDSFLSPEVGRSGKEQFSQSAPRYESFGGRAGAEKRNSGGSFGSRPETPITEKRGNEPGTRPRKNTGEKLTRPQQLSEEFGRRTERHSSPQSDRHSTGRSSRGSNHSSRRYYSSSDDLGDSDSDGNYKRRSHGRAKGDDRHLSASRTNPLPGQRLASPLISPKVSPSQIPRGDFERSETFPQTRDGRGQDSRPVSPLSADRDTPRPNWLNPLDVGSRPKPRQPSSTPLPKANTAPYPESLPIPIPTRIDLRSPGDSRRTPSIPQFDGNKPSTSRPQPQWQPPAFQPPSSNLDKPVGSYRRFSEEIERGSVAPLPSCPRMDFSKGRNDWLTLPNCPGFDICPSCFNSIIAPTEFRGLFVAAPRRSPETEVLCDFGSSPWYRIAWLLTLKEKRRDLNLFYGLANIAANVQPCLGSREVVRPWYSIIDPKTRGPIRGFDVCHSCVRSVETLLPAIRGIFVRTDHGASGTPRACDLRFDSKRFIQYFDALETTADRADYNEMEPDTRDLANLARRMSVCDECQHDRDLINKKWHIITQLPEFTVCDECFEEIVWPELEDQKAIPLMFNKELKHMPKASCQLYSPKMRGIFRLAVDSNDYKMLAAKARERKTVEMAYKANVAELRTKGKGNPAAEREAKRVEDEWRRWE